MELREYAETVLFGTTLEEKLVAPGNLRDELRGDSVAACAFPSRPASLRPADPRLSKSRFPSDVELESEPARARVLHAFANHELLALEIMALGLLRFPDADPKLRGQIAATMRDEQAHLELYRERMEVLGASFGDEPVSRFFWDALSDMRSIDELMAGMSLGFEQANLDFSLRYEQAFREHGDVETADVMRRVYEDEVRHVGHGARWLATRCADDDEAFRAWTDALPDSLTARDGRGRPFSREARLAAGLPSRFIDAVEAAGGSRRRPGRLFVFNPDCEGQIAGRASSAAAVKRLVRDLATIPIFLAGRDDSVLVGTPPSLAWLTALREAGFETPECVTTIPDDSTVVPWGLTPGHVEWQDELSPAFGKAFAASCLGEFGGKDAGPSAVVCDDEATARRAIEGFRDRGHDDVIVKADLSASGRHRTRDASGLERLLSFGGRLVVEPWFERALDLSVQLDVTGEGTARVLGTTRLFTDGDGRYRGSVVGSWTTNLPADVARAAQELDVVACLERAAGLIARRLADVGYSGPAGVDGFVFRDGERFRFRPIVDVNPRHTMGRVALRLSHRVERSSPALWLHVSRRDVQANGVADFAALTAITHGESPVVTSGQPGGRIRAGVLFTTEPREDSEFGTLLVAGEAVETLRRILPALSVWKEWTR